MHADNARVSNNVKRYPHSRHILCSSMQCVRFGKGRIRIYPRNFRSKCRPSNCRSTNIGIGRYSTARLVEICVRVRVVHVRTHKNGYYLDRMFDFGWPLTAAAAASAARPNRRERKPLATANAITKHQPTNQPTMWMLQTLHKCTNGGHNG